MEGRQMLNSACKYRGRRDTKGGRSARLERLPRWILTSNLRTATNEVQARARVYKYRKILVKVVSARYIKARGLTTSIWSALYVQCARIGVETTEGLSSMRRGRANELAHKWVWAVWKEERVERETKCSEGDRVRDGGYPCGAKGLETRAQRVVQTALCWTWRDRKNKK